MADQPYAPMDSAPHDGTRILLLVTTPEGKLCAVCGHWDSDKDSKRARPYWANDLELKHGKVFSRSCRPIGWQRLSLSPPAGLEVSRVA